MLCGSTQITSWFNTHHPKKLVMKTKLLLLILILFGMCSQPQNQDEPEETQATSAAFLSSTLIDLTYAFDDSYTILW